MTPKRTATLSLQPSNGCSSRYDGWIVKAGFEHPARTVGRSEIEAALRHEQHVKIGQQTSEAALALIVDQTLEHNDAATFGERVINLP